VSRAKTGNERWHVEIADFNEQYFPHAPIVVGITSCGDGDDLDAPGFLQSRRSRKTGALQWKWYTVPQKKGDPGMNLGVWTLRNNGGGNVWIPGAYDPETHL